MLGGLEVLPLALYTSQEREGRNTNGHGIRRMKDEKEKEKKKNRKKNNKKKSFYRNFTGFK